MRLLQNLNLYIQKAAFKPSHTHQDLIRDPCAPGTLEWRNKQRQICSKFLWSIMSFAQISSLQTILPPVFCVKNDSLPYFARKLMGRKLLVSPSVKPHPTPPLGVTTPLPRFLRQPKNIHRAVRVTPLIICSTAKRNSFPGHFTNTPDLSLV